MPAAAPDPTLDAARLFAPLAGEPHVALAVSGGSDSLALMHLAAAWPGRPLISVLTVDHGLRAAASVEAATVGTWAAALGLAHHTLRWDGAKPASGVQAKARAARYGLMSQWCRDHGASALMTAHTLDDQAETVLMRMARTASIDSLAGIPPLGQWAGVRLFRPLLGCRREVLRAYLAAKGQHWIEDPSNADTRFERVRIRQAMPVLASLGITAEHLAAHAAELRDLTDRQWRAADAWVAEHVMAHPEGFCEFPLSPWRAETEALKGRILGRLIGRYGSGRMPGLAERSLIAGWAEAGSARRTLGGALLARRSRALLIGREPGRLPQVAKVVPESGELLWDGRFQIFAPPGSAVVAAGFAPISADLRGLPAFVRQALPAVKLPGGGWQFAVLEGRGPGSARFAR